MIRLTLITSFMLFSFFIKGQQNPVFTQYYTNDVIINPAISGSKKYNKLIIQTRQQWLGFDGAPTATNVSFHGALNNRSAMGGYLMFDQSEPSMRADANLSYAYHIPLDYDNVNLSFGLSSKLIYYNLDFANLDLPPGNDDAFSNKTYTKIAPEASAGAYLYSRYFYFGYSSINLLQQPFKDPVSENYPNLIYRNHFLMGGYRFQMINNDWELEPSFLFRHQKNSDNVTAVTLRTFYLKNTSAGVTYKNDGNIGLNIGFGAGDIHFSYSYDYTFKGDIASYNYGTHELIIEFRFATSSGERHISFWEY